MVKIIEAIDGLDRVKELAKHTRKRGVCSVSKLQARRCKEKLNMRTVRRNSPPPCINVSYNGKETKLKWYRPTYQRCYGRLISMGILRDRVPVRKVWEGEFLQVSDLGVKPIQAVDSDSLF